MAATTDLERVVEQLRRGAPTRQSLEALRRGQQPEATASAEDCLKAGRDPARVFDPIRRQQGTRDAA
ncbi:hypothetical protein [Plastoroseomonas arctica]|uniref:Uncharacterized protein n=1 Tax=Plastoroseomonas arctica TaxID=1509237 RepID=A0AAF1JZA7_9PROT|nr:hypothetical protein [Plastoroseomonas arctica]MBR0653690.1 hypothetical protein [Plastoroseomonas arctica]